MKRQFLMAVALVAAVTACDKGDSSEGEWSVREGQPPAAKQDAVHTEVHWTVPGGWIEEEPANQMRKAQFATPKADGDAEDGSVVITFFPGEGQVGGAEANIQRWYSQMKQPDGGSTEEKADVTESTVDGMKVTRVEMTGTYTGGGMMMGASEEQPGYMMIATIIQSKAGPYFVKMTGPENTVKKWEDSYDEFIESFVEDSHTH